jgi:hypothetical protein
MLKLVVKKPSSSSSSLLLILVVSSNSISGCAFLPLPLQQTKGRANLDEKGRGKSCRKFTRKSSFLRGRGTEEGRKEMKCKKAVAAIAPERRLFSFSLPHVFVERL